MSENKIVRPVSFNKTRDDDQKMLKHLEGKNFSGYVKSLILEDLRKNDLKIIQRSNGGIKIVVPR